ncbi:MAG: class I SAM-dependent methyltransferase [Acidimicrobiia bacterium]|nr:MAG: class I SAM-dependent methyltransferase [Acidimicrobiia bacterium]
MSSEWDDLAEWWSREVKEDEAYASDVHPILLELLPDDLGVVMDLGCGEGQMMRIRGGDIFGCDLSLDLLRMVEANGRVVQTRLPDLGWLGDSVLDSAYSVYLLDLIQDHDGFFSEAARAVRPGGSLVIVINHPVFTAPGSGPFVDDGGEILWRWGAYFLDGSSTEPAGDGFVEFFHRPMSALLSSAAEHGWALDRLIERGLSAETIARIPFYEGQDHIPRLLGVRWTRLQ